MKSETIAVATIGIALAGLMIHFTTAMNRRFDDMNIRFDDVNRRFDDVNLRFDDVNRRFDDMNRRFDDAVRQNDAAHAQINTSISELRADFRALIPRPAAEPEQESAAEPRDLPESRADAPDYAGLSEPSEPAARGITR